MNNLPTLLTLYDHDVFDDLWENTTDRYEPLSEARKSVRGVIVREDGKMALMHVSKYGYYKLPGGGVDERETIEEAFIRECKEEAEVVVDSVEIYGIIEEYEALFQPKYQKSVISYAEVIGDAKLEMDEYEIAEGYTVEWVTIDEALKKLQEPAKGNYISHFIVKRDRFIVEYIKKEKAL